MERSDKATAPDHAQEGQTATPPRTAALSPSPDRYRQLFQVAAIPLVEIDLSDTVRFVTALSDQGVDDPGPYFALHPDEAVRLVRTARIVDGNDHSLALFGGMAVEELQGDLSRVWPVEFTHVFVESVLCGLAGKARYEAETHLRTLGGREFEAAFIACFPAGTTPPTHMLGQIAALAPQRRPRTALETSERRYRNLFQFLPFPLLQLDRKELASTFEILRSAGIADFDDYCRKHPDFVDFALDSIKIVEVNRRTLELFGAHDPAQLLGPVARLWTENPEVFQRSMGARYNGALRFEAEIKLRRCDGRLVDVLYVTDFPEALQNEPLGLACLIDITERLRTQEALRQLQAEFAHAGRVSMLGELTASIAHEVNQPLSAILTNAEAGLRWLDRPEPDLDELRALTEHTAIDARRASDIIRRVRDMAAPSAPNRRPTPINAAIEDVALFLRHELKNQQVELALDLAPNLPDPTADRVQVQQVLANLIVNAMQAMAQAGTATRRIAVRTVQADPTSIRVEVADTGPGIAEDHLASIFASFFTTKASGMGMGLAICRSIIEGHGGEIRASNAAAGAGGALFTVTLPLAAARAGAPA